MFKELDLSAMFNAKILKRSEDMKDMTTMDPYQLERFSKTKEEFDAFYDEQLQEKVKALDKERQKTMQLAKTSVIKIAIPAIIAIILYFFFSWMLVTIPIFVYYGRVLFKDVKIKRRELEERLKKEVVTDLVTFMNEHFTYKPNGFIPSRQFVHANIFKDKPNRYKGDDLISGYIGSDSDHAGAESPRTDVSFSEVKADKVTYYKDKDGKKSEQITTMFCGLFFKADFNKAFDGLTIVIPKEKKRSKGFAPYSKEEENQLEYVDLEDMEFMDTFDVKTSDQVLARYILTPNFMNRLLEFSNRHSEEDLKQSIHQPTTIKEAIQAGFSEASNQYSAYTDTPYFSFRNGTMYFLLPTQRDHFDFNIMIPLNKRLIYSYFKDINIALEMVDELNLNLRIWTKQ